MSSDKRHWTHAGLDELVRNALNEGLASSALWSLLLGVMERRAARKTLAALLETFPTSLFGEFYVLSAA